ncbi:uncharacterized protein [Littorina saxatilis]|uniref:Receptor protein-tyrosine kinase n=1 Tax=Littorina saxatilis TaxID=31220 RepID=A0AAN9AZF0_9CAEN
MKCVCLLLLVVHLGILFVSVEAWSGNTVTYRDCCYRYRRVCRYRWWGSCCSWKTIKEGYYCTKTRCRYGWTDTGGNQVCNKPVCWPSCKNGGTCVSPGRCNCPVQFTGYRCDSAQCSYLAPCYPGTCQNGDGCDCASGFQTTRGKQNYCLEIEDNVNTNLDMYQMQVRMSFWPRYKNPPMELHYIMADSTDMTYPQKDSFWTNRDRFNRLETTCSSQYFPPDLTGKPNFITGSTLGVVQGNIQVKLIKLDGTVSLDKFLSCEKSVSNLNPETEIFNCSVQDPNFDRLIEHRDRLEVTYRAKGGGYREVLNGNTNGRFNQSFTAVTRSKAVEFKFDLIAPVHCIENSPPCTSSNEMKSMLNVPDFTRSSRITISWDNWGDGDSGMYRYAWEVFKMTKGAGTEIEIHPDRALDPLINQEVLQADYAPQSYDLSGSGPGMYSVILEAGDLANNTKYVRRLVVYDPNPTITTDPAQRFYVTSANAAGNYTYQNDISAPITITWAKHFRNALHEENNLLGKVRPYPKELRDDTEENKFVFRKVIPYNTTKQDDWEGERTANEIPNRRGIVNFKIQYDKDSTGGVNQGPVPTKPWIEKTLTESYTIPYSVPERPGEGDTVTIWVKATDAMGTEKVEKRQVTFDSTQPDVRNGSIKFLMNVPVPGIHFSSMFEITAQDPQSGIAHVLWTFTRSNGSVLYQNTVPGARISSADCDSFECTCTPARDCFYHKQTFPLSNCEMIVEKESLDTEVITVTADVTNMAGLVKRVSMLKDDLTALNGTESYFPPQNISLKSLTADSCTITWSFPPSCFHRTGLWVLVNGETDKRAVHEDATEFAITGLEPATQYQIFMVTDYGDLKIQSDKTAFKFTTAEQEALTPGAIAGIVIGFIIIALLILMIIIFCLWKRGVIFQKEGTPVNKQLHRVSRAINTVRQTVRRDAFTNNAYKAEEDDIYMYGAMAFSTRQPWQLDDSSLTLMDHVGEGRFATIYKASWRHDGKQDIVAAKMLKAGFTEDDAMKMMAKINFSATQLEDHDNVVKFFGAVTDNQGWGPVLVMEYCEMGQMDKWLAARRSQVTEQIMENLFRFAVGIAKGMEYLASKKVTHSRLAARNILLTFTLDPKVAGFGPQHKQGDEEKATRVPAKWAAPEVLQDKPATEKSDVWSYGIVLWEIFSMGQVPYPNIHGSEVGARIKSGYRMEKPEFADDTHYDMMKDCWQFKQSKRPTFGTIRARLSQQYGAPGNRQSVDFYYDSKQLGDFD